MSRGMSTTALCVWVRLGGAGCWRLTVISRREWPAALSAALPAATHHDLMAEYLAAVQLVDGPQHVLAAGQLHERIAAADRAGGTLGQVPRSGGQEQLLPCKQLTLW